jgi:hypothetical protein
MYNRKSVALKILGWQSVSTIHELPSSGLREWKCHLHEGLDRCGQKEAPVGDVIQLNQPPGSHVASRKAAVAKEFVPSDCFPGAQNYP